MYLTGDSRAVITFHSGVLAIGRHTSKGQSATGSHTTQDGQVPILATFAFPTKKTGGAHFINELNYSWRAFGSHRSVKHIHGSVCARGSLYLLIVTRNSATERRLPVSQQLLRRQHQLYIVIFHAIFTFPACLLLVGFDRLHSATTLSQAGHCSLLICPTNNFIINGITFMKYGHLYVLQNINSKNFNPYLKGL